MKTRILIPLMAGLALLWACKGKSTSGYEAVNNSSDSDIAKKDSIMILKPKLVKTAGIHFKVKNVQQTTGKITSLTTSCNGMIVHHQMGSSATRSLDVRISDDSVMRVTSFNTTAEMTIKIPSSKLEEYMNQVAILGLYVNDRSMEISDKSLNYLSSQMKLNSRKELVGQQKTGKIIIKKTEEVLQLKDDMVDQQINNLEINDAVKYSVVNLSFYQSNTINKEIIANDDPSAYNLPFYKRLLIAFEDGWGILVDVIIGLTNLWALISIAAVTWFSIRYYKNKKIASLAKTASV